MDRVDEIVDSRDALNACDGFRGFPKPLARALRPAPHPTTSGALLCELRHLTRADRNASLGCGDKLTSGVGSLVSLVVVDLAVNQLGVTEWAGRT